MNPAAASSEPLTSRCSLIENDRLRTIPFFHHSIHGGRMNWEQVCASPHLQDLPFKIETSRYGQVVMSPATNWHGRYQSSISILMCELTGVRERIFTELWHGGLWNFWPLTSTRRRTPRLRKSVSKWFFPPTARRNWRRSGGSTLSRARRKSGFAMMQGRCSSLHQQVNFRNPN